MIATIEYSGRRLDREKVIEVLEPTYTPERLEKIKNVLQGRTHQIAVGLEGLYDRGNVSAVMRSAEALGFFDVHVVETSEKYREANRVTKGAEKWLRVHRWQETKACVSHLKEAGFRIVTTQLDPAARSLEEVDFSQKTAIFFGNERDGASEELLGLSDERVILPMLGFVESFNISVAAALCLYHIQQDRKRRLGAHGDLTPEEARNLYARYLLKGHKTEQLLNTFEIL